MKERPPRRAISGVLLLDKPTRIGSNAVLQHAKHLYRAQRAGHTGTLDPMASGMLVICFGEATKFSGELLNASKVYVARIKLGITTTTADAEGEILERKPVDASEQLVREAIESFRGEIRQTPPMYSALKRDGRPLYTYARRGETVERQARTVTIHAIDLLSYAPDELELEVSCSKGTYIRTLAEDLGRKLGCGAHLSGLIRTALGEFRLQHAANLDQLERSSAADRDRMLLPTDVLVGSYPEVTIGPDESSRFRQGARVPARAAGMAGLVRVYGTGRMFLGIAWSGDDGALQPKRLLAVYEPASETGMR